ncbi:anthrax toxin receptor-like [Macrosteles quadrilineatus]|uniref:anthrax toxin receptor-like n=1 Tax=Macrosteles quadrilineatus TaxID=74068 RepID=UPI0023E0B90F|nr:anthrax toxin receptor-like [Macrosteles quadrilineatus]
MKVLLSVGLVSAILLVAQAVPYPSAGPGPYPAPYPAPAPAPAPMPYAGPMPYAFPEPSCCAVGQPCGLGLCGCCGDSQCENGACNPIIPYAGGFYGAPRVQGGYGNTFPYGR